MIAEFEFRSCDTSESALLVIAKRLLAELQQELDDNLDVPTCVYKAKLEVTKQ